MADLNIIIIIFLVLILWTILRLTHPRAPLGLVPTKPEYHTLVNLTIYTSGEEPEDGWTFWKEIALPVPPVAELWIEDTHYFKIGRVQVTTLDGGNELRAFADTRITPYGDKDDVPNQLAILLDNGWQVHAMSNVLPDDVEEWRERKE